MKKKLRAAFFAAFSFTALSFVFPGFSFTDNTTIVLASLVFALLYLFVRPVLKMLSIPLNFVTFGLFGLVVNVLTLFSLTKIIPSFKVVGFHFGGFEISGFALPATDISFLASLVIGSLLLSLILSVLFWIFE